MQISRIFTLFDTGVYIENFKTVSENLIETHRKYLKQYADYVKISLPACSALTRKRNTRAGVFWYRILLTKHVLNTWFNFFDANIGNDIAEALNESFILEELEISEMRS